MKSRIIAHSLLAALSVAGAIGNQAAGATVPVVNPPFETNQLFNGSSPTNWNARGNSGQYSLVASNAIPVNTNLRAEFFLLKTP